MLAFSKEARKVARTRRKRAESSFERAFAPESKGLLRSGSS